MSGRPDHDRSQRPPIEVRLSLAGLPPLDRPAWLEIDTGALEHDLRVIRDRVGVETQVWPVVKDDAYGHGVEVVTRSFVAAGASGVCVATLGEARVIRAAGIATPVLILYPIPEGALAEAAHEGFAITIATSHGAEAVARAWSTSAAAGQGARLTLHLEIETGFTRMGIAPERLAAAIAVLRQPGLDIAALWSHLATPEDPGTADEQERRLTAAVDIARASGVGASHLAASGGLLTGRGVDATLVRPGLTAYGVLPDGPVGDGPDAAGLRARLRPAMRLIARPLRIQDVPVGTRVGYGGTWAATRPSRIATLPVGYGDGYARAFTGAEVLVRGKAAPVVGVVSMDACTVDVTDIAGVGTDDEFVLLGTQGDLAVTVRTLAQRRNTIPWEVLAGMARRLTRVYDAAAGPSGVRTLTGETLVR